MSGEDRELLTQRPTKNGEAYELYLKGRYYVAKRSEEAIFKGRDFFRQAIDKDPTYALAYAGISDTYTLLAAQAAISPRDAYPAALATARKAMDLDPKLAEAHASFAHASFHIGDYQTAEREFTRALALKPNSPGIYQWQAEYASALGRYSDAEKVSRKALELDPLDLAANAQLAYVLIDQAEYDQAAAQLKKTVEIDPNYFLAHAYLGNLFMRRKQFQQAIAEYKETARLTNNNRGPGGLGLAYALSGNTAEARRVAEQMEARAKTHYTDAFEIARIYAALHNAERTIRWLRAAREDGDSLRAVHSSDEFAFVRNDARVTALIQQR